MPVCKTQYEILVAHLWKVREWRPTHELMQQQTPFGFIGSAGHVRARELARNAPCVPEKLRSKIQRKRGSEIGLDPTSTEARASEFPP